VFCLQQGVSKSSHLAHFEWHSALLYLSSLGQPFNGYDYPFFVKVVDITIFYPIVLQVTYYFTRGGETK